jgi:hypothetical protein
MVWTLLPSLHSPSTRCPLLPCVTYPFLLSGPRGLPFCPSPTHPATHLSFHISFPPRGSSILDALLHGLSSVTPLCYHSRSSPLLPRAPQCHRSFHTPCPSLKLVSCSRWQLEKSSPSRDAELAEPSPIPRSSY